MHAKRKEPSYLTVQESNLSIAWWRALDRAVAPGVSSLMPLVVSIHGFDSHGKPEQHPVVEEIIDRALAEKHWDGEKRSKLLPLTCSMSSNTIFPASLWARNRPRHELYARYHAIAAAVSSDPRSRRGTYFGRLIAYPGAPAAGNQLEHLIRLFELGVTRKSAYQASISLPSLDMTAMPQQGFPCMQQIALHPDRAAGTLGLVAFYGTQYIIERAYGNYLGLCRLAAFVAHEMGLVVGTVTCVAGYASRGSMNLGRARRLRAELATALQEEGVVL